MDEALTIRVRRERGYAVVTVAGEVDIATVAQLREPLFELAAGGRPLVVDLDQVSFIDASGLGALVGAAARAAGHGASLHVACGRPQTVRLFRLTGLDHQIPLARSLDEALQALAAGRGKPALAVSPVGATPARRPGRRAGLERGLDGGRDELRGLRVDGRCSGGAERGGRPARHAGARRPGRWRRRDRRQRARSHPGP